MLSLEGSLSEITGPTFGHTDSDPIDSALIRNYAKTGDPVGERIIVHGWVLDEYGRPVPKTLVEIWQKMGGSVRIPKTRALPNVRPIFEAGGGSSPTSRRVSGLPKRSSPARSWGRIGAGWLHI